MRFRLTVLVAALGVVTGCQDAPTAISAPPTSLGAALPAASLANDAPQPSSVRWNRAAIALFRARGGNAGRMTAYLSLAQYRAVLAADDRRHGQDRPSPAGAAAGASVVVLKQFYPGDATAIDAALATQRAELPLGTERNKDFEAGEAIGREVAAGVVSFAASDNFGLTSPGVPPVGPGYWTSSGAAIARGGLGARPFFLTSATELRSAPPPPFGSPAYLTALDRENTTERAAGCPPQSSPLPENRMHLSRPSASLTVMLLATLVGCGAGAELPLAPSLANLQTLVPGPVTQFTNIASATETVTGGTGRFARASGQALFGGTVFLTGPAAGTGFYELTGTLDYTASDRAP